MRLAYHIDANLPLRLWGPVDSTPKVSFYGHARASHSRQDRSASQDMMGRRYIVFQGNIRLRRNRNNKKGGPPGPPFNDYPDLLPFFVFCLKGQFDQVSQNDRVLCARVYVFVKITRVHVTGVNLIYKVLSQLIFDLAIYLGPHAL